ncbi:hypothetical protein CTAYLR_002232 [Chrysophaeum taylorii]|uniref:Ribosomal RNA small subunit methyltransferase G n=1 Tax=Chrysophaeum taylorii TaxID=2483200 RepID=A0AAD7XN48_9STRA|nr:hypothetical protein CTAYLR_002232 [Chrysophaeum taylorii]
MMVFTAAQKRLLPWIDVETWERLDAAARTLLEWNQRINVVSRKGLDATTLVERHYLPALALLGVPGLRERWEEGVSVLDAGTGGGFPGLPLAIACPNAAFTLADGRGRKITVVDACAEAAAAANVRALHGRVPDDVTPRSFDFVLGRSVARLPAFIRAVEPVLRRGGPRDGSLLLENGVLYVKGGDFEDELAELGVRPRRDLQLDTLIGGVGGDKRALFFPTSDLDSSSSSSSSSS